MKLVTQVMFSRLVAARVRLLDLYGNKETADAGALYAAAIASGTSHDSPG